MRHRVGNISLGLQLLIHVFSLTQLQDFGKPLLDFSILANLQAC